MKKLVLMFVLLFCIASVAFAETYTGTAENIRENNRGVVFEVVVKNEAGEEVLRREQWVSTGVFTPVAVKEEIKKVVERMTQDMWAHKEGAEEFLKTYKTEIENYNITCSTFVPYADRASTR